MPSTYVYLIVFAIAVVLLILVFGGGAIFPKGSNASKTTTIPYSSPSGTASTAASTTTLLPAVVNYTAINIEYWYDGPSSIPTNITCTYSNYTTIDSQSQILNGSASFVVVLNPSTSGCPLTWDAASAITPGFSVTSVVPSLPYTLPPNSTAQIQLTMKTPDYNFDGPLTIAIYQS